jgi:hypothetical protein
MDVSEMLTDLGDHGFTDTSTATKVRMLQDTIWEIEGLRPWPFLESEATLTFSGSSGLASNFPAAFKTALKLKDVQRNVALDPVSESDLEDAGYDLSTVGVPKVYYPVGDKLYVWPIPPSSTTVRMRYLRSSTAISSSSVSADILIPARHHRLIVLGALVRLYDMEDDPELAARFQGHYETRLERMVDDLFRKQLDRPDHVRVHDPDAWDYDF